MHLIVFFYRFFITGSYYRNLLFVHENCNTILSFKKTVSSEALLPNVSDDEWFRKIYDNRSRRFQLREDGIRGILANYSAE